MKSVKLTVGQRVKDIPFQVTRLGLHESMLPCLVDRTEGTGDYLFMLFYTAVQVRTRVGEVLFPPMSLMIWTPSDSHYYGTTLSTWDHSWFHCSGRKIGEILRTFRIPTCERISIGDPALVEHFLLEAISELSGWSRPDGKILRNLFENFICAVARQAFRKSERLVPAPLLEVRAHVEQHFTERLRLSQLARRAGWSEPYLCAEFRRYFGIPVIQYALQLRMNHATYLLRDRNRRVGEIALALGYPDLYAFSKMFKRYAGVSPRKFRELNLRNDSIRPRRSSAGSRQIKMRTLSAVGKVA